LSGPGRFRVDGQVAPVTGGANGIGQACARLLSDELGMPALAPALANAVFRLSGVRVRSLPFFPDAKMCGL
jgi:NAD(P)-dependent dehydrogenase (short-subunit alcohol dehydrogenase family)